MVRGKDWLNTLQLFVAMTLFSQAIVGCATAAVNREIPTPPPSIGTDGLPHPIPLVGEIEVKGLVPLARDTMPTVAYEASREKITGIGIESSCPSPQTELAKAVCQVIADFKGLNLSKKQQNKLDNTAVLTVNSQWGKLLCGRGNSFGEAAGCYIPKYDAAYKDAIVIVVESPFIKTAGDLKTFLYQIEQTHAHELGHAFGDDPLEKRGLLNGDVCIVVKGLSREVFLSTNSTKITRDDDTFILRNTLPDTEIHGLPSFGVFGTVITATKSVQLLPIGLGTEIEADTVEFVWSNIRLKDKLPLTMLVPHYLGEAERFENEYGTGKGKLWLQLLSTPGIRDNPIFLKDFIESLVSNNPAAIHETIAKYVVKDSHASAAVISAMIHTAEAYRAKRMIQANENPDTRLIWAQGKSPKEICATK